MVYRVYAEKKPGFDHEAAALYEELKSFLGIEGLAGVRILNRYDVENIDAALFEQAVSNVFSEPMVDDVYRELPEYTGAIFAAEYLPGQFDQRADSAAQCVQLLAQVERPDVRTATVYILAGDLSAADIEAVKKHVINPVERREASLVPVDTLKTAYAIPTTVQTMTGFIGYSAAQLADFIKKYGLAMDEADIAFCQEYFAGERRDPTLTEIRMIDTYWSDHCRHTTFFTELGDVTFEDADVEAAYRRYLAVRGELNRTKPICLMDIATIGAKYLKAKGVLTDLDESEEINACTIKMDVEVNGETQKWLLLFKNETHNHPTEIEPFGGAATCIGGAIRDPLSGRGYVYQAMRVTGAADPTRSVSETIPGKLPQRQLVTTAAAGYSSYGNQIGLATGLVEEIYHDGYAAKRMEIGAVV
ncbi:MAG: phosphoribosylformylglycinamidine synthase, partial [Clostridia bacterium]|nr:phosphoribosylformylglycinamidine synthase [Clostridia bacterium]